MPAKIPFFPAGWKPAPRQGWRGPTMDRRSMLFGAAALGIAPLLNDIVRADVAQPSRPRRLWPESHGALSRVVLMLSVADGEQVLPTIGSLLAALRPTTHVELLCADRRLLRLA